MKENYSCCNSDSVLTAMVPRPTEEMKVNPTPTGMYTKAVETLDNLREVMDMLELFRREIDSSDDNTEVKRPAPTSFKENIDMIHVESCAIKLRLEDLMAIFRS